MAERQLSKKLESVQAAQVPLTERLIRLGLDATVFKLPVLSTFRSVIDEYIPNSRMERQLEFLWEVVHEIQRLHDRIDQALMTTEVFYVNLEQAVRVASLTLNEEKRAALRAAAINVAIPPSKDETFREFCLACIDDFTAVHIRLLRVLQDPRPYVTNGSVVGGSLMEPISAAMGEIEEPIIRSAFDELYRRGFTSTPVDSLRTMMTSSGVLAKRTTDLGDRFLSFITLP